MALLSLYSSYSLQCIPCHTASHDLTTLSPFQTLTVGHPGGSSGLQGLHTPADRARVGAAAPHVPHFLLLPSPSACSVRAVGSVSSVPNVQRTAAHTRHQTLHALPASRPVGPAVLLTCTADLGGTVLHPTASTGNPASTARPTACPAHPSHPASRIAPRTVRTRGKQHVPPSVLPVVPPAPYRTVPYRAGTTRR